MVGIDEWLLPSIGARERPRRDRAVHAPALRQDAGDNPFVSPSGPASQPSGPDYVTPPAAPPPTASPVPYGPPPVGQPYGFQPGWAPAYGAAYPGSLDHKGATTSLVLGIVSIVSLVLAPLCCVTFPGVFCAPFAWVIGAKAKREIDAAPGVYGNLGHGPDRHVDGDRDDDHRLPGIVGFVALVVWIGSPTRRWSERR